MRMVPLHAWAVNMGMVPLLAQAVSVGTVLLHTQAVGMGPVPLHAQARGLLARGWRADPIMSDVSLVRGHGVDTDTSDLKGSPRGMVHHTQDFMLTGMCACCRER